MTCVILCERLASARLGSVETKLRSATSLQQQTPTLQKQLNLMRPLRTPPPTNSRTTRGSGVPAVARSPKDPPPDQVARWFAAAPTTARPLSPRVRYRRADYSAGASPNSPPNRSDAHCSRRIVFANCAPSMHAGYGQLRGEVPSSQNNLTCSRF